MQQSKIVNIAEPDLATTGKLHAFALPVDGRLADQWHLRNTGFHRGTSVGFRKGADARVLAAWERADSLGSRNVIVAVIDDGFDLDHPDLSGEWKIVAPRDFTRNSRDPRPDTSMGDWHGTACAGVAVGNADGTGVVGVVGVAPRCRLMPIRWSPGISDREIEDWFGHAQEQGAWVISCSWGVNAKVFRLSTRMHDAIHKCATEGRNGSGCVICFAAGNENHDVNAANGSSIDGFAIHPDVIAVAASNSRDRRSSYSNFGKEIALCAPSSGAGGWGITTSDVMGQYKYQGQTYEAGYSAGPYTDDFGGTSSACPLVAGTCALLLSIKPELTAVEVKDALISTARKIGPWNDYVNGHSIHFGAGCIDCEAAVLKVLGQTETDKFWGKAGHNAVNRIAISALSGDLETFYGTHASFIEQHSMDADNAKRNDPKEGPRHFIDLDEYGDYPFAELPEDMENAIEKFGKATVYDRGILPWQIEITFSKLEQAWKKGDFEDVLFHSAWLGHYVGDAHVPLHTTANHNGQLTGQKGLHSYFESRILNERVSPGDIRPVPGKKIDDDPHTVAFRWVRESHTYVAALLAADLAARDSNGKRIFHRFAETATPIAVERLGKACSRLASLWITAWENAGRPKLNGQAPRRAAKTAQPADIS